VCQISSATKTIVFVFVFVLFPLFFLFTCIDILEPPLWKAGPESGPAVAAD